MVNGVNSLYQTFSAQEKAGVNVFESEIILNTIKNQTEKDWADVRCGISEISFFQEKYLKILRNPDLSVTDSFEKKLENVIHLSLESKIALMESAEKTSILLEMYKILVQTEGKKISEAMLITLSHMELDLLQFEVEDKAKQLIKKMIKAENADTYSINTKMDASDYYEKSAALSEYCDAPNLTGIEEVIGAETAASKIVRDCAKRETAAEVVGKIVLALGIIVAGIVVAALFAAAVEALLSAAASVPALKFVDWSVKAINYILKPFCISVSSIIAVLGLYTATSLVGVLLDTENSTEDQSEHEAEALDTTRAFISELISLKPLQNAVNQNEDTAVRYGLDMHDPDNQIMDVYDEDKSEGDDISNEEDDDDDDDDA